MNFYIHGNAFFVDESTMYIECTPYKKSASVVGLGDNILRGGLTPSSQR